MIRRIVHSIANKPWGDALRLVFFCSLCRLTPIRHSSVPRLNYVGWTNFTHERDFQTAGGGGHLWLIGVNLLAETITSSWVICTINVVMTSLLRRHRRGRIFATQISDYSF